LPVRWDVPSETWCKILVLAKDEETQCITYKYTTTRMTEQKLKTAVVSVVAAAVVVAAAAAVLGYY